MQYKIKTDNALKAFSQVFRLPTGYVKHRLSALAFSFLDCSSVVCSYCILREIEKITVYGICQRFVDDRIKDLY